jgi:hypothetical protein
LKTSISRSCRTCTRLSDHNGIGDGEPHGLEACL